MKIFAKNDQTSRTCNFSTILTCKGEPEFSFVGCIEKYGKIDVSHAKNFGERKSTLHMNIMLEIAQTDPN